MKKLLLSSVALVAMAGSAIAADLPSHKAPIASPPAPPMWTGFYAGLNAGGTWTNNSSANVQTWNLSSDQGFVSSGNLAAATLLSGSGSSRSSSGGFIGGGQIGYNWQLKGFSLGSGLVTGVEADIQGTAVSGGTASRSNAAFVVQNQRSGPSFPVTLLTNQSAQSNLQYLGTVRGRLGILAMPSLLVYGTGGLAYGGVSTSTYNTQFWLDGSGGNYNYLTVGNNTLSSTQVGWTAGGGAEWMFLPNWSLKAEYLYYDLGNKAGSIVNNYAGYDSAAGEQGLQSITNYTGRVSGNIIRAGVNYHFNFANVAPVVAKF